MMRFSILMSPFLTVVLMFHAISVAGWSTNEWPRIDHVSSLVLEQGESGDMNFTFRNRLPVDLENVTLWLEIYLLLREKGAIPIAHVSSPPDIEPVKFGSYTPIYGRTAGFFWSYIPKSGSQTVKLHVSTKSSTTTGHYILRLKLTFSFGGKEHVFVSRGHLSDEEWTEFEENGTLPENCAGIIPETSFVVKDDPQEVITSILLGGGVIATIAGIYLIMRENKKG